MPFWYVPKPQVAPTEGRWLTQMTQTNPQPRGSLEIWSIWVNGWNILFVWYRISNFCSWVPDVECSTLRAGTKDLSILDLASSKETFLISSRQFASSMVHEWSFLSSGILSPMKRPMTSNAYCFFSKWLRKLCYPISYLRRIYANLSYKWSIVTIRWQSNFRTPGSIITHSSLSVVMLRSGSHVRWPYPSALNNVQNCQQKRQSRQSLYKLSVTPCFCSVFVLFRFQGAGLQGWVNLRTLL